MRSRFLIAVAGASLVLVLAGLCAGGGYTLRKGNLRGGGRKPDGPEYHRSTRAGAPGGTGLGPLTGLHSLRPNDLPLWEPDAGTVTCTLPGDAPNGKTGYVSGPGGFLGWARVENGSLVAMVPEGSGRGTFSFPGIMRGTVEWRGVEPGQPGECVGLDSAQSTAGIYGTIEGDPFPDVSVNGCGGVAEVRDGTFFLAAEPEVPCELAVYVESDGRIGTGPSVRVTPPQGEDVEVKLRYPRAAELRARSAEEIDAMRDHLHELEDSCSGEVCQKLTGYFRKQLEEAEAARVERPDDVGGDDVPGHP